MMNIYAIPGAKVILDNLKNGYPDDLARLIQHGMKVGDQFTVERTAVSSSSSTVYFQEMPGIGFNTVNFRDADPEVKDPLDIPHPMLPDKSESTIEIRKWALETALRHARYPDNMRGVIDHATEIEAYLTRQPSKVEYEDMFEMESFEKPTKV